MYANILKPTVLATALVYELSHRLATPRRGLCDWQVAVLVSGSLTPARFSF